MSAIILVRHAEPEPAPPGSESHWTDTALSELGRHQAALVAARLADELRDVPRVVVSSDLRRASQTAEAIAASLGGEPVETTADLREFNNGGAIGSTEEALREVAARQSEAETWAHFHLRVSRAMQAVYERSLADGRVPVVVSHYGAMINIVSWWLELGLNDFGDTAVSFDAELACITVLRTNRQNKRTIARLNDTGHYREAGLARRLLDF